MAEKVANFTLSAAKRIAQAVKKVEADSVDLTGAQFGRRQVGYSFWAEIVAEDPGNPGSYSWKFQVPQGSQLVDRTPAIDSGTDCTAHEINDEPNIEVGKKVRLTLVGYDQSTSKPIYLFSYLALDPSTG